MTKATANALLDTITRVYGERHGANFQYNTQSIANEFLSFHGCSFALDDLRLSAGCRSEAQELAQKLVDWADTQGPPRSSEEEMLLQEMLAECRDRSNKLALRELEARAQVRRNGALEILKSGAKGDITILGETVQQVGQQYMGASRIAGALPGFAPCELKIQHVLKTGLLLSNFVEGLSADDQFLANMPARDTQFDNTTMTSSTGYNQRRLTKGMEGIAIGWDWAVRMPNNELLSMNFGGDGFDPMFVQNAAVPVSSRISLGQMQREFDIPDNALLAAEFFSQLVEIRTRLLAHCARLNRIDDTVEALGSLQPVVMLAFCAESESGARLSAADVWVVLREFVSVLLRKRHLVPPIAFLATVYESFNPARLAGRVTRESLSRALKALARQHARSLVQTLTQVGILAAQSISEPTTQLTLKSSHTAGTLTKAQSWRAAHEGNHQERDDVQDGHAVAGVFRADGELKPLRTIVQQDQGQLVPTVCAGKRVL